ncbi:MAG: helix-hairpin-helix domain-containing protein [Oscillospiraceae bacterium]|nr:helix-hairpin-helix domain-containing protein [Oscillospiraceae bacterium]
MKRQTSLYILLVATASVALIIYENADNEREPFSISPNISSSLTSESYYTNSNTPSQPIDLNIADIDDLILIEGISQSVAQSIIDYRNENGGFSDLSELYNIDGIEEETIEKLLPFLYIEQAYTTTIVTTGCTTKSDVFYGRVNLNTGTFEEFSAIPILTEEQAYAIIELREKIHYFSHYYELLYAEGFDEKLVAALGEYVYVENSDQ